MAELKWFDSSRMQALPATKSVLFSCVLQYARRLSKRWRWGFGGEKWPAVGSNGGVLNQICSTH